MYFDTHAHYDDRQFDDDRHELINTMRENGVSLILNPASSLKSSERAVKLAETYPFIYAAVGTHPHSAGQMDDSSIARTEALAKHHKVVAIGEIGLDYHYDYSPRDVQRQRFREQMELARKLKLPVIIHEREATADCLEIVREYKDLRGVYHCYSGSLETAEVIISQGWYISFTGAITFKNARKSLEVIEGIPIERIMIETDAPYLAPVPNRGQRNSSLNLPYVVDQIARLKNLSHEEVAEITMENGKRFFSIAN